MRDGDAVCKLSEKPFVAGRRVVTADAFWKEEGGPVTERLAYKTQHDCGFVFDSDPPWCEGLTAGWHESE